MARLSTALILAAVSLLAPAGCDKPENHDADDSDRAAAPTSSPAPGPARPGLCGRFAGEDVMVDHLRQAHHRLAALLVLDGGRGVVGMITRNPDPEVVYHLLLREAQTAGIRISDADVRQWLKDADCLPGSPTHQNVVDALRARGIMLPERALREALSDWLAVTRYFQRRHPVDPPAEPVVWDEFRARNERVKVRAVVLAADDAALAMLPEPTDRQLQGQFEAYRDVFPGAPTPDRPFGFGYKTPDRVSIRYLFIDRDKLAAAIEPALKELFEWYMDHREQLVRGADDADGSPGATTRPTTQPAVTFEEARDRVAGRVKAERAAERLESITHYLGRLTDKCPADQDDKLAWARDRYLASGAFSEAERAAVSYGQTGLRAAAELHALRPVGMVRRSTGGRSQSLVEMAFACAELADVPPTGAEMRRGEIGPVMETLVEPHGRVIWQLADVRPAEAPAEITPALRRRLTIDLKRKAFFDQAMDRAAAVETVADMNRLAAEAHGKAIESDWLRRMPGYQFQFPTWTGVARSFGSLPDPTAKALLDAAFALAPPDPAAGDSAPARVVPNPAGASVLVVACVAHEPVERAEFEQVRQGLAREIRQQLIVRAAVAWYSRDEVFARTGFAFAERPE